MSHASVAARAQAAAAERAHGPPAPVEQPNEYAGLVTRAIAFAVDALVVNLAGISVAVVVGLGLSILDIPDEIDTVLLVVGGLLFAAWSIGYFVAFWSTTGQTPGDRLMLIRVRQAGTDQSPPARRALLRLVGLFLAALPLLLGFLPILLTERRRGLHDYIAGTVVVSAPGD